MATQGQEEIQNLLVPEASISKNDNTQKPQTPPEKLSTVLTVILLLCGIVTIFSVACILILSDPAQPIESDHPFYKFYDNQTQIITIPKNVDVSTDHVKLSLISNVKKLIIHSNSLESVHSLLIQSCPAFEELQIVGESVLPNAVKIELIQLKVFKTLDINCNRCMGMMNTLTLEHLPSMVTLSISGQLLMPSMTDIHISSLPSLQYIGFIGADIFPVLENMELNALPSLTTLYLGGWKAFPLATSLDIQNLPLLHEIEISGYEAFKSVTELHLSKLPKLEIFTVVAPNAFTQLIELSFTDLPYLNTIGLFAHESFLSTKNLVLDKLPGLETLSIGGKSIFGNVTRLEITELPNLQAIFLSDPYCFPSLVSLTIEKLPLVNHLSFSGENVFPLLETLNLFKLPSLTSINFNTTTTGFQQLRMLTIQSLNNLTSFNLFQDGMLSKVEYLSLIHLDQLKSIGLYGQRNFASVKDLQFVGLPLLESVVIDQEGVLVGEGNSPASVRFSNVPKVHTVKLGPGVPPVTPFYKYQKFFRGKNVSDIFYGSLIAHVKKNGFYKYNIEEIIE